MLPLSACPDGAEIFLDANVVYYHFVAYPPLSDACSDLLARISSGHVTGHTSAATLADAVHKVMMADVVIQYHVERAGLIRRLREHREWIAAHQLQVVGDGGGVAGMGAGTGDGKETENGEESGSGFHGDLPLAGRREPARQPTRIPSTRMGGSPAGGNTTDERDECG